MAVARKAKRVTAAMATRWGVACGGDSKEIDGESYPWNFSAAS